MEKTRKEFNEWVWDREWPLFVLLFISFFEFGQILGLIHYLIF